MDIMQQPVVQALSRALVHFLWQGAALGVVTVLVLRLARPRAAVRYGLGVVCLAVMAASPIVTTAYLARSSVRAASVGSTVDLDPLSPRVLAPNDAVAPAPADAAMRARTVVVCAWLAGVFVLSVRLVGGWLLTRRLLTRAQGLAAPEIRALARQAADRLAVTRVVRVLESSAVAVPMMIGWIAPVVILPVAALAGLTPTQIEALIAHELAHVRRHDYLVNLLQSVVETLLFYHPAVWWISREVREAREHCCDDLAVAVCDRVVYASALADLAAMTAAPRFALAATDGSLATRVRRILGADERWRPARPGWLSGALVVVGALAVVPLVAMSAPVPRAAEAPRVQSGAPQVTPADARKPVATLADVQPASSAPVRQDDRRPADHSEARPELSSGDQAYPDKLAALRARLADLESRLIDLNAAGRQSLTLDDEARQIRLALAKLEALRADVRPSALADQKRVRAESETPQSQMQAVKEALDRLTESKTAMDVDRERLRELAAVKAKLAAEANGDDGRAVAKLKAAIEADLVAGRASAKVGRAEPLDQKAALDLLDQAARKSDAVIVVDETSGDASLASAAIKSVHWDASATVGQAIDRAGLASNGRALVVQRLSSLNVTWEDGDRRVTGRSERLGLDATLHAGDILIVRVAPSGGGK